MTPIKQKPALNNAFRIFWVTFFLFLPKNRSSGKGSGNIFCVIFGASEFLNKEQRVTGKTKQNLQGMCKMD